MSSAPARREQFERVVAAVYEPLQRYLRRRARADDAADALADTLIVVWRRPADHIDWCLAPRAGEVNASEAQCLTPSARIGCQAPHLSRR